MEITNAIDPFQQLKIYVICSGENLCSLFEVGLLRVVLYNLKMQRKNN